ncbi:LysR family transcriptional regulator [Stappia sp. BW2]|uniref:LysR family transcriptional regulator n=1 Tax=Stappia sp. BW2 TaxID=2592622 RepID=UPI0011DE6D28|nr:LysR family transcriptional regulator [Stappia sp. BW2]TYC64755.1 LysR family transcriptional regulator [Stappia sp. BW2]
MLLNHIALRYFVTVAETGSFRRASEALNIAASAVNRQIVQLEETLGAELFERRGGRNSLRLTAAGETLLVHARAAMNEMKRASEKIGDLKGLRRGSVSLGVPETFARDFVPTLLAQFHRQLPGITFDVTVQPSPDLIRLLMQDEVEVAMTYNPPNIPDLVHVARLARSTYAMVRDDHPLASKKNVRIVECAQYPMIMPAMNSALRVQYDRVFGRADVKPVIVFSTNSYEMMRSMASSGIGLALVTKYIMPLNAADETGVVYIPVTDRLVEQQHLGISVRRSRHLSLAVTTLISHLQDVLAQSDIAK